jgi:hypothetical protein
VIDSIGTVLSNVLFSHLHAVCQDLLTDPDGLVDESVSKADENWLKIGPRTYNTETRSFESPWPFGPEGGAQ